MIKLFAQLVFAAFVIGLSEGGKWPIHYTVLAVLIGVVVVHTVWGVLFPSPFLNLGARPIDPDDPLMQSALEQARQTLGDFFRLYKLHHQDSLVKFRFTTDQGQLENVWGELLEVDDTSATISLVTQPVSQHGPLDERMTIALSDIVDWQVEFRDGSLRGGFTNLALFKIYERDEGRMHPKFLEQVARFQELKEDDFL